MGYKASGSIIVKHTQGFSSVYTAGEAYLQWLREKLVTAGWTRERILATAKYSALAMVDGNTITVGGHSFSFTNGPDAPFAVHVGADQIANLANLQAHTIADIGWDSVLDPLDSPLPSLTWSVPAPEDEIPPQSANPEYTGNILPFVLSHASGMGFFDYNPESGTGLGRSWGGGFTFTSATGPGGAILRLVVKTVNTRVCDIVIDTTDSIASFTGIQVADSWTILANRYQCILYVVGSTAVGRFLLASNLYPYGALASALFICGPVNAVTPSGASRSSLDAIGTRYYVNVSGGYFTTSISDATKTPTLVFPGYGFGTTVLQKLDNRIDGRNILRDDGKGIPFDAMIAARVTQSGILSDKVYIIGWLWDALVSSVLGTIDTIETIQAKDAVVLISQPGADANSRGSLLVQSET